MGEEHGQVAPFLHFTDHGDPAVARAAREARVAVLGRRGTSCDDGGLVPAPLAAVPLARATA